MVDTVAKHALN